MDNQFEKGFEPTLFKCIDEALATTLGKDVAATFYFYMAEEHKLTTALLPQRPLDAIQYLKKILGEAGFRTIERPIISNIKTRFEIKENVQDLPRIIELAKRNYLQESL